MEHIFRHKYGQLVAVLMKRFGSQHLPEIEDAVQFAMMRALEFWVIDGEPHDAGAWLYQVAYRKLLSTLKGEHRRKEILTQSIAQDKAFVSHQADVPLPGEMNDSLLRALFFACHPNIPTASQIVFLLKSLLGFDVKEIALRLFLSEENVYKRYTRARLALKDKSTSLEDASELEIDRRIPAVLNVLYTVFTEGYLSSHSDMAIRKDLCTEAIRLGEVLLKSRYGNKPNLRALLALMYLHLSRLHGRQGGEGHLLLLEEQDRSLWSTNDIAQGLQLLQDSAEGTQISRYHIEAGIAAEHCLAPSFKETRWQHIVKSYELLEQVTGSPLVFLNRVLALAEWKGLEQALDLLNGYQAPPPFSRSYHWFAVEADLLGRQKKDLTRARTLAKESIRLAPNSHIARVLKERFISFLSEEA
ncbi:MAG: sigma-70 family RNA polymerase sigma factor [Pseudobacteriovorax sp.]|nr:sigma-70 family RNA polymerase sigma factor [Pseudobacteriovorax sp.]